jgi:hypothetical protein
MKTAMAGLLIALFFFSVAKAQGPDVIIKQGPAPVINKRVEGRMKTLLGAMNTYSKDRRGSLKTLLPTDYSAGEGAFGINMLQNLVDSTGIVCEEAVIETSLITLVDGNYEVRGVRVMMDPARSNAQDRTQELVMEFEPGGAMYSARLAMAKEKYSEILEYAEDVQDAYRRKKLVSLLEQFRTAYNTKDIAFIQNIFDENALIIIGRRVSSAPGNPGAGVAENRKEDFELTRKSKSEYVNHLRDKVFKNSKFINLDFENIFIYQHPKFKEVYGVNLFQKWRSDKYSDDGYLFLMIDYENELEPKIYVRAWQPEPFRDGSVIDMNMFTLVK